MATVSYVDEAPPRVIGQQQLGDRLLGAVAGGRSTEVVVGDDVGDRRPEDRDRGAEDQAGRVARAGQADRFRPWPIRPAMRSAGMPTRRAT